MVPMCFFSNILVLFLGDTTPCSLARDWSFRYCFITYVPRGGSVFRGIFNGVHTYSRILVYFTDATTRIFVAIKNEFNTIRRNTEAQIISVCTRAWSKQKLLRSSFEWFRFEYPKRLITVQSIRDYTFNLFCIILFLQYTQSDLFLKLFFPVHY